MVFGAVDSVAMILARNPKITQKTVQMLTGLSNRSIRYAIDKLKVEGAVRELVDFKDVRRKRYLLL